MLAAFLPDVAILGIGLPGIDGYSLARSARRSARPPHLIALTGYGTANDRERALDAGFDEHLVKPVDPALLVGILARAMARRQAS